jgi:rhodanese-related sulfurtransferase
MKIIKVIESLMNFFDIGIIIESIQNSIKHKFELDFVEIFKYLLWGKGYYQLTPPQLTEKLKNKELNSLIIDLREKEQYEKNHIEGSISIPFDDFFRSVFIEQKYSAYIEKDIVLVCDTGHMSRVAGSVLAEEGFKKVYSLKRGMRRWRRWQNLVKFCANLQSKKDLLWAYCWVSK